MTRLLAALALCCVAVLCGLTGCATKQSVLVPASPDMAASTWKAFEAYCAERDMQTGPYRLQCSLRYNGPQGEGNRASAILWGNNDHVVRLDIMAGIGMLVGRVRQSDAGLIIHSPREDKAWTYQGRGKALLSFGVPIPLAVQDVVATIQGRYFDVFGPVRGLNPYEVGQGSIGFSLEGGRLPGTVELTPDGLLTHWQEAPGAWSVHISYDSSTPPLPKEIEIDHPEGRRAVLTVNARQSPAAAFNDDQLRLDLPPGTTVETMRQASR